MGQIGRRRRKKPLFVAKVKQWLIESLPIARGSRQEEEAMPNASLTSRLPSWFNRLWHLPDQVRWMDPLPPRHRRGIIAALLVILLAFLWPAPSPQRTVTPIQSGSSTTEVPLQAEITDTPLPRRLRRSRTIREPGVTTPLLPVRRWHSCSATIICRLMTCLRWRR